MVDDPNAQPGEPKTPQGDDNPPKEGEGNKPPDPSNQFVTPDILKGVLERQLRTYEEKLGKTVSSYEEGLKTLHADIAALKETKPPTAGGKDSTTADSSELVSLRKQVKELEDAISKATLRAETADKKEKEYRFETTVKDALLRHECVSPDIVFPAIRAKLKVDDESGKITATEETEFGIRDLTLDEYVKSVVAKKIVPQLFKGKMRPGSAAGGDEGLGEGGHKYTIDQLKNSEFYEKNLDAIRAALEAKQVKLDSQKA
jgi:hypothetical protein